ncbi:hypothetical protein D3105_29460 [Streptomyces globisporus]|uniref:Uncharacterized protein n=1 Tax=Streptomyces globisporus TaxID=1908 RepID=A0A423URW3_STRGL|nr:hypothetical protein D3105_29460 [Streptomyces globisporus]
MPIGRPLKATLRSLATAALTGMLIRPGAAHAQARKPDRRPDRPSSSGPGSRPEGRRADTTWFVDGRLSRYGAAWESFCRGLSANGFGARCR